VRKRVGELAQRLELPDQWQLEVAALLSQIGHVTLPGRTLNKLHLGLMLNEDEQKLVDRLPYVTDQLLANIPHMEPIREIIRHRDRRYDGMVQEERKPRRNKDEAEPVQAVSGPKGEDLPIGSRMLKIVLDFDTLEDQGTLLKKIIAQMNSRAGWYDPKLLQEFFAQFVQPKKTNNYYREVTIAELQLGMVFAEDVKSVRGALLVSRGHEVSPGLLARLQDTDLAIKEPLIVWATTT